MYPAAESEGLMDSCPTCGKPMTKAEAKPFLSERAYQMLLDGKTPAAIIRALRAEGVTQDSAQFAVTTARRSFFKGIGE